MMITTQHVQKIYRIQELEQLIKKHQHLYYNKMPEISDSAFDILWEELKTLAPEHELFQSIPSDASDGFVKAEHIIPMGSQEKAADPEQFHKWAAKMPFDSFLVQYKLDGAGLELQYQNGVFLKAVTRGDGKKGDDITENVKKMKGFIAALSGISGETGSCPFSGGIRGEVIMTKAVHREYYADKANCRNAANGLMKRKDGQGCKHLTIICYDAAAGVSGKPFTGTPPFTTETEKLVWLQQQGFACVPMQSCTGAEAVIAYRSHIMDIRDNIPYDIDGLVVKHDHIDPADLMRSRPEKQIAFKFSLEQAVTVIRSIEWSQSGVTYTPVAIVDMVRLAGTSVKRASLSNPNMISAMNLKIGSRVIITKRGEIIPKIESLVENPPGSIPIDIPCTCAVCGTPLADEGSRLYCPAVDCPKLLHHRLEKWIRCLDIQDFGEQLIKQLFDSKRLQSITDLYTLTIDELASLDRMGPRSAKKVYRALHEKREIPLAVFIAGFDIDGIGQVMVEKLVAAGFDTLEKLLQATPENFAAVYQFGHISAQTLVQGLAAVQNEMYQVLALGVVAIMPPAVLQDENLLFGKSFCFTGELHTLKRKEAEARIKKLGGIPKITVSKGLNYLVTNTPESGSSKNKKAKMLNIPLITEQEFLEMLKGRD